MSSKHDESRRAFLSKPVKMIPVVALASSGFVPVASTAQTTSVDASAKGTSKYTPKYFQDEEWAFLNAAVDHLIPEDELGPGAVKAGVPEFIDRQMETPYAYGKLWYMQGPFNPKADPLLGYQLNMTPRDVYRSGITALNTWCKHNKGNAFAQLDKETQLQVLKDVEGGKIDFGDNAVPAKTFFSQLLSNTKEGFFADPQYGGNKNMVAWKMIGFPGARADFMDWIDHPNEKYPFGPVSISGERG